MTITLTLACKSSPPEKPNSKENDVDSTTSSTTEIPSDHCTILQCINAKYLIKFRSPIDLQRVRRVGTQKGLVNKNSRTEWELC